MSTRGHREFDGDSYAGTYSAIVLAVVGDTFVEQGFRVGMARDITYDISVDFPDGSKVFKGQTPKHRRPSEQTLIIAAVPGDECTAIVRGNVVRFIINEGIYSGGCT